MGNSSSSPTGCNTKQQYGGKRLYKMIKEQQSLTEENTINFRRNDIQNTLSDRSIIEVMHRDGFRVNAPSRDRYTGLETQKLKNKNSNIIGGNNSVSSVSIDELSAIKNLVMNGGGCGCGENTVLNRNGQYGGCGCGNGNGPKLNGGFNDSATSSFMPQTMDLSATSITNNELNGDSATSSFMPQTMDLSATSITNNELNGGSATSSFMPQTMDLSATSITNNNNDLTGGSVTSSFMPNTIALSATSVTANSVNSINSNQSGMNRLLKIAEVQFGGNDESEFNLNTKHNSTSELINALSLTSESNRQPHDYSNIVGGAWGNKKQQRGGENINKDDINESSSSSTQSTTESVKETLKRLSTPKVSSTRSKTASSTSSEGTSDSSFSISSTHSSSSLNSSSSSISRKSSPYSANVGSISGGNNIYLATESMSGGNFIDAKQFYSSEHGDLYSSDTNYLRHNINKRRFR